MNAEREPALEWIHLSPPEVAAPDRAALLEAFDSGWIAPAGPAIAPFEAAIMDYTGAEAAVALSSGSAALELGLRLVGVQPGDEVVVQTATFAASAFAVVHVGATPVFCDVASDTWSLDPERLETYLHERAAMNRLPAAIIPVDLYGNLPDYSLIVPICSRYDVPIVEDAAEALGSISGGCHAGTFGTVGVFSFNGNKIITTSCGGMLVGPSDLVERARFLAAQARERFVHYEHLEIGFNYRMSNLLAALGHSQLDQLEGKIERRQRILDNYRAVLPELDWMPQGVTDRSNAWLCAGILPEDIQPGAVCQQLLDVQIEARPLWKPMHAQPVFAGHESIGGDVADSLFEHGICLPSGSSLTEAQQDRVVSELRRAIQSASVRRVT